MDLTKEDREGEECSTDISLGDIPSRAALALAAAATAALVCENDEKKESQEAATGTGAGGEASGEDNGEGDGRGGGDGENASDDDVVARLGLDADDDPNEIAKIVMINEPRPGDSDVHAAGLGGESQSGRGGPRRSC